MAEKNVLIVGAGLMGKDIARVFLKAGYLVTICDLETKLEQVKKAFEGKPGMEILSTESLRDKTRVHYELVLEAINEDYVAKKKIFEYLNDVIWEKCIFASNTSTLSISKLAEVTTRKDKFVGMHFFNPAPVVRLIEIIKGKDTSLETINRVQSIVDSIGKKSVIVNDMPGFIVNRLLFCMLNEAFYLAYNKIADIKDIDEAMKLGVNYPIGPFALTDLIGLDVCYAILKSLEESLKDNKYKPCPLLKEKIDIGCLGRKTGKGFYEYKIH